MAGPGPPYGNETMKFSENWLRSHVPTQATRDELAATLTAIGLEVEEVAALGEGPDAGRPPSLVNPDALATASTSNTIIAKRQGA